MQHDRRDADDERRAASAARAATRAEPGRHRAQVRSSATASRRSSTSCCRCSCWSSSAPCSARPDLAPGITFAQYFVAGMIASGVLYTSASRTSRSRSRWSGTTARSSGIQGTPMPKVAVLPRQDRPGLRRVRRAGDDPDPRRSLLLLRGAARRGRAVVHVPLGERARPDLVHAARHRVLVGAQARPRAPRPSSRRSSSCCSSPPVCSSSSTSCRAWMQQFASLFPLKWLTQAMRSVFLPESAATVEVAGSFELGRCALRARRVVRRWARAGAAVLPLEPPRRELTIAGRLTLPRRSRAAGVPGRRGPHRGRPS